MNDRIEKLRRQSLDAVPFISLERAKLLTEFYKNGSADNLSIPVARALAFKYLLENKELCINENELFVGERGPLPKATPTYPEICTHTLDDFEILNSREKVSFKVENSARKTQSENIIPFWSGKSIRDKIFKKVAPEWIDAYKAGVFTEFQEQRAPGHTVLDDKIYRKGFIDFKKEIERSVNSLDPEDPEAENKKEQLKAMSIAADALMLYAGRYSEKLKELAENESNTSRKAELMEMSKICGRVPANKPETFREALQYYWFVHLGVITELNTWDSFNPGRLDQHLLAF